MRKLRIFQLSLVALSVLVFALTLGAAEKEKTHLRARLVGIEETPTTVITNATGTFTATINDDSTMTFTVTYKNLSTPVTQAHIHIGARAITGGVAIFFCSNLGNGPAGTPACPNDATNSGSVTRTVSAADVIGPAGQGVPAGDFADVVRAVASGVTYANVHTTSHPGGEIRGRIRSSEDEDDELPGAH
jgi:hypothetical protein